LQSLKLVAPSTTWRHFGGLRKWNISMLPEVLWEFLQDPVIILRKFFSARFARIVNRLWNSVTLLNLFSADKIWDTHMRVNFLKPSSRSRMLLMVA
jgi:hypothetical protein